MSGGHFEYLQYRIGDSAETIREYVEWHLALHDDDSPEVRKRMKSGANLMELAAELLKCIDYYICADHGSDSFISEYDLICRLIVERIKGDE